MKKKKTVVNSRGDVCHVIDDSLMIAKLKRIFERDRGTCQRCGERGTEVRVPIDPDDPDRHPLDIPDERFECLCLRCFDIADRLPDPQTLN